LLVNLCHMKNYDLFDTTSSINTSWFYLNGIYLVLSCSQSSNVFGENKYSLAVEFLFVCLGLHLFICLAYAFENPRTPFLGFT